MKLAHAAPIVFILAAAVFVFSFVRSAQNDQRLSNCQALCQLSPTYAGRNRRVPEFSLPNMRGEQVAFSSFLGGKPVVLNFWTKTCGPCLDEMPSLQEAAALLKRDGIKVVTICTDDGPDAIRDVLKVALGGQEPNFEILFNPETTVVTDKFGTTLYPETWVIDGNGVIRMRVDGKKPWNSSIALEVIDMISRPFACPVEYKGGRVTSHGDLCDCVALNSSCIDDVECCDPEAHCVKGFCKKGPVQQAPRGGPGPRPTSPHPTGERPPPPPRSPSSATPSKRP